MMDSTVKAGNSELLSGSSRTGNGQTESDKIGINAKSDIDSKDTVATAAGERDNHASIEAESANDAHGQSSEADAKDTRKNANHDAPATIEPVVNNDGNVVVDEAADVVAGVVENNVTPGLDVKSVVGLDSSTRQVVVPLGMGPSALYGREIQVDIDGNFPSVGSRLGPFFCLQTIGRGTFSSIHKCINLAYYLDYQSSSTDANSVSRRYLNEARVAVAKVEHASFQQSGVLESEAAILDYLHRTLPTGTVPTYMGRYKCKNYEAIVMEWLPGNDMHALREKAVQSLRDNNLPLTRRIHLSDAVYLTSEVMLPLLRSMHEVGVVHRDVKPSNCVSTGSGKQFAMVDFGLSKSIVVPEESTIADKGHPWEGENWLKVHKEHRQAYYRKEREKAEFRGTSMYASLRVHQYKDYAPRDDMWSLLYVFCDLVSGGLPWMQYAANRDREMCQKLKERIHGEGENEIDHIHELLMGDEYHVKLFRREQQKKNGEPYNTAPPASLEMANDTQKVDALRRAFSHLAKLSFWDRPDYELIKSCIDEFLKNDTSFPQAPTIDWTGILQDGVSQDTHSASNFNANATIPLDMFRLADKEVAEEAQTAALNDNFVSRLPVANRFLWTQLVYDVSHKKRVTMDVALRDWMAVVDFLTNEDSWDTKRLEGANRTNNDGFRRPNYLRCLERCRNWAKESFNNFTCYDTFYESTDQTIVKHKDGTDGGTESRKRRKTSVGENVSFTTVSTALYALRIAITQERKKMSPPPMQLHMSFN